jgi:sterol desaturase/sphingolipid hydroxylase (fatty acid hydroxylase superfamily)
LQPFIHPDLWINLFTGAAIFILVAPLMRLVGAHLEFFLVQLPSMPAWLQLTVSFLLLDFCRYWLHYAHHRVPFLWRFHRVHHSSENLDATSGLRMHAVDFVQLALLPIILFGVLIDTSGFAEWVIPTALSIGVFFDAFQHANISFPINHPLGRLWHSFLNNPHFHIWHHTADGNEVDGNYSNTLIIWDRVFGTDVTQKDVPSALGLGHEPLKNSLLDLQLLKRR